MLNVAFTIIDKNEELDQSSSVRKLWVKGFMSGRMYMYVPRGGKKHSAVRFACG